MSAPSIKVRQAENLEYGFLAARAIEAIDGKLKGDPTSASDDDALLQAKEFLNDVVQGVSLVSGKEFHGHSARVVTALKHASRPVEQIQHAVSSQEDFAPFILELAESLTASEANREYLESAREFFQILLNSLRDAIVHRRLTSSKTPISDGQFLKRLQLA